ncbi:LysR family transcriptional regulator [Vibrio alginolyticus]
MKSEPFERVTLKMLRYFYEVAQTKHFTKAAENLNITNSPLSNRIKELEEVLNVKLFERDSRNVMLTEGRAIVGVQMPTDFSDLGCLAQSSAASGVEPEKYPASWCGK